MAREEWHTYQIGQTKFNDEAIRQAGKLLTIPSSFPSSGYEKPNEVISSPPGEMVIHNMRQKKAAYNLINNNCQNFAVLLLDTIQVGKHREFGTTYSIYQRATGKGTIKDLFTTEEPSEEEARKDEAELQSHDAVQLAQKVMDENTTKLDESPLLPLLNFIKQDTLILIHKPPANDHPRV